MQVVFFFFFPTCKHVLLFLVINQLVKLMHKGPTENHLGELGSLYKNIIIIIIIIIIITILSSLIIYRIVFVL